MQYENIEYEKRNAIAYVTLNRPDKLNALSPDLQLEVRHAAGGDVGVRGRVPQPTTQKRE